ncbi:MAG: prepilin peptidase [Patescibacteria group bacterium]
MEYLILFFLLIFGLIIGSFLNCLIWRLHKNESLLDRSYCPKCKQMIVWYDNIPVLSFILLRGKCRQCQEKISWQYPIVELITGLLFLIAFYINVKLFYLSQGNPLTGGLDFGFILNSKFLILNLKDFFIIAVMIVIFIYDLRWYLILDSITLPASALVLVFNLILGISWFSLLISAIIGISFFLIQFLISRGKWIGGGDIRLGLLMGLALGRYDLLILAIILAYFAGSIVGLFLIYTGRKEWGGKVPLGVFLTFATIISLFWGSEIINWYLSLF